MSHKNIIGIDNGLDGGCCALDASSGRVLDILPMPNTKFAGRREIDPEALLKWILIWKDPLVAMEEPLHYAATLQSMRSMSISFGKLIGICSAADIPFVRVQVPDWHKKILGEKIPKGLTKSYALDKASLFWPTQNWCVGKSKVPHDGIVDAALIAKYANENNIQEPNRGQRNVRKTRRAR